MRIIYVEKRGELMPMTPKQMIKLLRQNGFKKVTQRGSHLKMYHPVTERTVIIPMHNQDLGKGLEQCILKQAGLH
ncbi:type II toxin-antitoxin system HicA family toxin [Listeria booriae]|uniref:type II toxin-antitoxin system HicA family toxin n=1 Tax=Listeria booriae TaxID=1552123 RepID=UPI00290593F6|nr:type II toxin-antitoxin system HicA family toxin [Listeria booriae]